MDFKSKELAKQTTIAVWSLMKEKVEKRDLPEGNWDLSMLKGICTRELITDTEYLNALHRNEGCALCLYDKETSRENNEETCYLNCPLSLAGSPCREDHSVYGWATWALADGDYEGFIAAADTLIGTVKEW